MDELLLFLLKRPEIPLGEPEQMASRPRLALWIDALPGLHPGEEPLLLGHELLELLLLPPDHLGVHLHQPLLGVGGSF